MPNEKQGDRIWLVLGTTTGVAVDVTLNKYSSRLPGIAVLCLWMFPAILFAVWVWHVEKTVSWFKHRFLEHPVTYILMFLILIPFGYQATATMVAKLNTAFSADIPKAAIAAPTSMGVSTSSSKAISETQNKLSPDLAPSITPLTPHMARSYKTSTSGSSSNVLQTTAPTPSQTVNAPNGIGTIGGTLINPQVNNFGYMQKNLTPEQMSLISHDMAMIATDNDRSDLITCLLGDSNSCSLAVQLVKAFRNAGWKLMGTGYNQVVQGDPPDDLIIIVQSAGSAQPGQQISSFDGFPPGAYALANDLRNAGIHVSFLINSALPPQQFKIRIGMHP